MPTRAPRPAYDYWRDVDGTHIPVQCRVVQIAVSKEHGALSSRLHKQGRDVGRGTTRLRVRFDHEAKLVSVRPHLVRVLNTPDGDQQ
ncbi:MAG: hypothetical protein ACRDQ4_26805 [Pseudonocardiaceae bacterium]